MVVVAGNAVFAAEAVGGTSWFGCGTGSTVVCWAERGLEGGLGDG